MFKRNFIVSVLSAYLGALFAFLLTLILAKYSDASLYGQLAFAFAIGGAMQIIVNFGSDRVYTKELLAMDDSQVQTSYILIHSLFQFLLLLITILLAILLFGIGTSLLIFATLWTLFNGLYPRGVYDYHHKILLSTNIILLERVIALVVLLIGSFFAYLPWTENSLQKLFIVLVGIRLIFIMIQITIVARPFNFNLKGLYSIIHQNIRQRAYLTLSLIGNSLLIYGLQIIAKERLGYSDLAVFNLALQLSMIMMIAQSQFLRHLSKEIFSETLQKKIDLIAFDKLLKSTLFFSIILACVTIAASFIIESYWLDHSYDGFFKLTVILSFWLIAVGPGMIINHYFLGAVNEKIYLYLTVTIALFALLIGWFTYTLYGIVMGPIIILFFHILSIFIQYTILKWRMRQLKGS